MASKPGRQHKYWHYLFVVSLLLIAVSILGLANGRYELYDLSSYRVAQGASPYFMLAGYLGMFLTILISPVPDYILLPVYGYLSSVGLFNPVVTLLVCLAGAVIPVEYVCGRYAARPLLLRGLRFFRITSKDVDRAEGWVIEHGKFSIFIATVIPFFYSVAALASGILRMGAVVFMLDSTLGFGLRYAALEYLGYYSVYVFSPSFDYAQRGVFIAILVGASLYSAAYLSGAFKRRAT